MNNDLPPSFGEPGYSELEEEAYLEALEAEEGPECILEAGVLCHSCGDCEKARAEEGIYDPEWAERINRARFEAGLRPWILHYEDVYCFRGGEADFNPDLNDLIKPYNLYKFVAFYWDKGHQRILDSTFEIGLERLI